MTPLRITLMGPFSVPSLADYLPPPVIRELPPGAGGAALVNLALARLQRGWPTDIITLDSAAPPDGRRVENGPLRLWVLPRRSRHAMRDFFREERTTLQRALDEAKPDVCHAHWTFEYGLAAVTQAHHPALVTLHDHAGHMLRWTGPRYLPLYTMSRRVLHTARCLTAVSPGVADYANAKSGRPVPVIPNCLSPDAARCLRTRPSAVLDVVGAWSWSSYRNARRGLQAFALFRARHPSSTLTLMGVGLEPGGPAETWARQEHLQEGVSFLGLPSWTETVTRLRNAAVVFHPALEESFSLPVAEALAAGVPVVAARQASGPAWLVEQVRGGLLADGTREQALADALEEVATKTAEPTSAADASARMLALCHSDTILAAYDRLYEDLLNQKPELTTADGRR